MTCMIPRQTTWRFVTASVAVLGLIGLAACDLTDVTDPTKLEESDVATGTGVDFMRRNVLSEFYLAASRAAETAGAFADEYYVIEQPYISNGQTRYSSYQLGADLRIVDYQQTGVYSAWQALRNSATVVMRQLDAHGTAAQRTAHRGQMFAVRGYAVLRLGEDFCAGFPLHQLDGYSPVVGQPTRTTAEVLERALADLDTAVVLAADSARILNFARVLRARTLLGLGRFADAAAAAQAVATSYVFLAEFGALTVAGGGLSSPLAMLTMPGMGPIGSVADNEGGNGLNFVSAGDPRVKTTLDSFLDYEIKDGEVIFVQRTRYRNNKYLNWDSPMVVSSGVEARLIEAESALETGDPNWLAILNNLRATQVTPALEPLADPVTDAARVNLLFRERAFWLFTTGHRLSDLRRLVRHYNRTPETVFPTGFAPTGVPYETATSMRFPIETEGAFNSAVVGCTGQ